MIKKYLHIFTRVLNPFYHFRELKILSFFLNEVSEKQHDTEVELESVKETVQKVVKELSYLRPIECRKF